MSKKVVVGMSGGVDSSVCAGLLRDQGYDVVGLFMHNWEETDENGCCTAIDDYEDVKRVCNKLGIPYYSINFAKDYLDRVFSYFLDEYKRGRTPNPDVLFNREIKFCPFKEYAKKLGADYIATGHYAKTIELFGNIYLLKAKDLNKDQTYFLNQLSQEQLKNVIFPLGDMEKPEVRKLAQKYDLSTAEKKDSTGVCFIGERRFKQFLQSFLPAHKGDIRDLNENIVGKHDGVLFYTLGQRKGLDIGGKKGGNGDRWFVIKKDVKKNILYVSQGEDDLLFSDSLNATNFNWISGLPKNKTFNCYAKFRYRQPDQKVKVNVLGDGNIHVDFIEKQRAVTPGQFVVLYADLNEYLGLKEANFEGEMICLGGGIIDQVFKDGKLI